MNKFKTLEFLFQAVDKAKAMIAEDSNRSFVVDVFDAGSNQKVVIKKMSLAILDTAMNIINWTLLGRYIGLH